MVRQKRQTAAKKKHYNIVSVYCGSYRYNECAGICGYRPGFTYTKRAFRHIWFNTTIYSDSLHYEKFPDGTVKCIEDEIPFELPEGWEWTRFISITINRDSERKPISSAKRTNVEKIYDYYGASGKIDKLDKYIFSERLLLIGEDGANLVTRSKPIAFFADGQYWVNNHAHCIDSTKKEYLDYLCIYINAIDLLKYITGSAQPKMTQDNMNSIIVPLPPFEEQLRIIKK